MTVETLVLALNIKIKKSYFGRTYSENRIFKFVSSYTLDNVRKQSPSEVL